MIIIMCTYHYLLAVTVDDESRLRKLWSLDVIMGTVLSSLKGVVYVRSRVEKFRFQGHDVDCA